MFKNIQTVYVLAVTFTKRFFRDKAALFFTFAFPLIFLMIFGTIFGSDDSPRFDVAIINNSDSDFSKSFVEDIAESTVFTVVPGISESNAKDSIANGDIDAFMHIPASFGEVDTELGYPTGELELLYDQGDAQLATTLQAVVASIFDDINSQITPTPSPFSFSAESIQTEEFNQLDYTVAGLVGFSILSLGIFSMSEGFAGDKKAGALKRIRVAPIKVWQLVMGTALNRVFIGIIAVCIQVVAAVILFDFSIQGDVVSLAIFTVLSTLCLFGFGMAIAGWARDSNQASPLANLVSFPMMFLSGVFFPVFLMPEWLQSITVFIPLTPVVEGLRLIMTDGFTIFQVGTQLGLITAWTVVIYFVTFKVFRWE